MWRQCGKFPARSLQVEATTSLHYNVCMDYKVAV